MKNAIIHLNWPMILAAAAAYYAIGALWYTVLFGKYWAKANNVNPNDRSGMVQAMVVGFLLTVVLSATIDLLMYKAGGKEWTDWFLRTYILVMGFAVGFTGLQLNYGKKKLGLWFVDIGYHVFGVLAACLILAKWGLTSGRM